MRSIKDFIIIALVVAISSVAASYSPEIMFISVFFALTPIIVLGIIEGFALSKTTFFKENGVLKVFGLSLLEALLGGIGGWNFGNPREVCFDTCAPIKDSSFMGSSMRGFFLWGLGFTLILNFCALAFVKLLMRRAAKKAAQKSAAHGVDRGKKVV